MLRAAFGIAGPSEVDYAKSAEDGISDNERRRDGAAFTMRRTPPGIDKTPGEDIYFRNIAKYEQISMDLALLVPATC